jgi:hypothetical protein
MPRRTKKSGFRLRNTAEELFPMTGTHEESKRLPKRRKGARRHRSVKKTRKLRHKL